MKHKPEIFGHPPALVAAAFSLVLDRTLARCTSSKVVTTLRFYCSTTLLGFCSLNVNSCKSWFSVENWIFLHLAVQVPLVRGTKHPFHGDGLRVGVFQPGKLKAPGQCCYSLSVLKGKNILEGKFFSRTCCDQDKE